MTAFAAPMLSARSCSADAAQTADVVAEMWKVSWSLLRTACPAIEADLAQLEHQRPTRARALARLEASAARASGRVLRAQVAPAVLLRKLLLWQQAVLAELDDRKEPHV